VSSTTATSETLASDTAAAAAAATTATATAMQRSNSASGSGSAAPVRVLCDGEQLLSNSQECVGCAAPQTAVPTAALHGAAQVCHIPHVLLYAYF
jgi:hypothetical protein